MAVGILWDSMDMWDTMLCGMSGATKKYMQKETTTPLQTMLLGMTLTRVTALSASPLKSLVTPWTQTLLWSTMELRRCKVWFIANHFDYIQRLIYYTFRWWRQDWKQLWISWCQGTDGRHRQLWLQAHCWGRFWSLSKHQFWGLVQREMQHWEEVQQEK